MENEKVSPNVSYKEATNESTQTSQALSEAKDEEDEKEDESDSGDDVNDYDANFYERKLDYAENKKTKKHIEDGNMKLFYLFRAQCSPHFFAEIKSSNKFEDL